MARRRLLPFLVAVSALLAPSSALAAPQWLPAETQEGVTTPTQPADVAADRDGNAVAVWIASGAVRAAHRARGGEWVSDTANLEPDFTVSTGTPPLVVARPDGTFVAVWDADRNGDGDDVLRSATRSTGGTWTAEDVRDLAFASTNLLEAGADGSVTVLSRNDVTVSSNTKAPGQAGWSPEELVPTGGVDSLAAAPDGSVLAAVSDSCGASAFVPCVHAARRPAGGPWGPVEIVGLAQLDAISGLAAAADPDSSYSVVWGETSTVSEAVAPPGAVRSADREAGDDGAWDELPRTVADLPADIPSCNGFPNCFDLAVGPDGTQLGLWHQAGESGELIRAALRSGAGSAWGAAQTAGPASTGAAPFGAITASGVPTAAWGSPVVAGEPTGSHRENGAWRPETLDVGGPRGTTPDASYLGDVAADGQGDAVTAWRDGTGVETAGFDAARPRFTAFSLPTGGGLTFSAAAEDNWSGPAAFSWNFGDGSGAAGATVSHTYGGPGTFTATATASDAVGNATQQSGPVTVTQTPPPPGDPCGTADTDKDGIKNGCDDNNGAERPKPFKTVNASVVSGEVFVKLPGAASAAQAKPPKGFVRLEGSETIPVGATLDTARGRVMIRSAATTGRKLQTGQFFRGRFVIRQARIKRRSKKLITDMRLSGSSFKKACGARASISAKRKRSKKRVRRLFGDAKGSFRTSGRNAAATVRGTRWGVQDRCDGTLVTVQRGRVQVRDKVKRKTIVVRTGHRYLARAR